MAGPAGTLGDHDGDWTAAPTDDPAVRRAQRLVANLNRTMAEQKVTQDALAARANVSAGTISNVRHGRQWPSVQVVARLEEALGAMLWPPYGDG